MFELLLSLDYAPFVIAFVVMLGIGAIEAFGLGFGNLHLDTDLDADSGIGGGSLLDWLGLGSGLPILVWLTSLLGVFTLCGFAVQQIATTVGGAPLYWGLATLAALPVAIGLNVFAAAGLSRIFPAFESTVIDAEELLMRRGIVLEGVASRGHPARAKVVDDHGQAHYVMIEPQDDHEMVAQGETALLVRKQGQLFFAVPDVSSRLRAI